MVELTHYKLCNTFTNITMDNRTFSKVFNKQVDIQSSTHQYQFEFSVNSKKIPHGNQEEIRKSVTLMNFILKTIKKQNPVVNIFTIIVR